MYKKTIFILSLMTALSAAHADDTIRRSQTLQEVQVSTTRASHQQALTTTTLSREQLDEKRELLSVPRMLELEPSVVCDGEQGLVGNTSMRIRGVDAARINVNINGITLNDAESQSVFWINIPNLGGMAQSLQIQRGVTAATGGSAAFGAAINLSTLNGSHTPYAQADLSLGSWNTRQYSFTGGSGLLKEHYAIDVAYNSLTSDGYIRNGLCDQQSLFLSASRYGERSLLKALVILGHQRSGITWDGASAEELDADPRFNGVGAYRDALGRIHYYDNETDNYDQRHYQLYYTFMPTSRWAVNLAADYTPGDGYDERYKAEKRPSKYGLVGLDGAATKSDFIYRKWMHNQAYTLLGNAKYSTERLAVSFGLHGLLHDGHHFGNFVWMQDEAHLATPDGTDLYDYEFYRNRGVKKDLTGFARLDWDIRKEMNAYLDLQYRHVDYSIKGVDDDYGNVTYSGTFPFFSPKVGWNWNVNPSHRLYAVAGISGREPTRADIKDAVGNGREIRGERMLDLELGYHYHTPRFEAQANAYAMLYRDQLTATGQVSSSGYALMENVDRSYRLGLELQAGFQLCDGLRVEGNLTLSSNKILDYVYHYDIITETWDWLGVGSTDMGTTDLSLSPSVVGAMMLSWNPIERLKLQLTGKYVGEMYCDNTSREEMLQPAYFLLNLRCAYAFSDHVELSLTLNNLLNHHYRTNAWVSYNALEDGTPLFSRAYFQQPGVNGTLRLTVKL